MADFAWPGWKVASFEMRVMPNLRQFTGPYTPNVQTLDLLGERLMARLQLVPTISQREAAAREAFFDRLKGTANRIVMGHLKRKAPLGSMRDGALVNLTNTAGANLVLTNTAGATIYLMSGTPCLAYAVAQGANTATLECLPGATLYAGDLLGINGQLVRIMVDTVGNGSGLMPIEFQPRARSAWTAGILAVWNAPTTTFILKPGSTDIPTTWVPGFANGAAIDLIESF